LLGKVGPTDRSVDLWLTSLHYEMPCEPSS
jgi:hypothetical protein